MLEQWIIDKLTPLKNEKVIILADPHSREGQTATVLSRPGSPLQIPRTPGAHAVGFLGGKDG